MRPPGLPGLPHRSHRDDDHLLKYRPWGVHDSCWKHDPRHGQYGACIHIRRHSLHADPMVDKEGKLVVPASIPFSRGPNPGFPSEERSKRGLLTLLFI